MDIEFINNSSIRGSLERRDVAIVQHSMRLLKAATQRRFDMVMCWSIDRLGRSRQSWIEVLNELQALKIDLFFPQQPTDRDLIISSQ